MKTFPSGAGGGVYGAASKQSIPKTSSVELPFNHGQNLPPVRRDGLHTSPAYPAAAFSTNMTTHVSDESSVLLLFLFYFTVTVTKAVSVVVFFSLDDAKSCRNVEACDGM